MQHIEIYALGICDFEALNAMYFPMISIGFLLAGIGMIAMLFHNQTENAALSVAPPVVFSGTPIMIGFMVIGLAMIYVVLGVIAIKLKKYSVVVILVLSFCCSLGMGYLSSKDFESALWNWIAQGINVVGQGTLLLCVVMLRGAGITNLKIR